MIWIAGVLFLFILQVLVILLKEHKEPSKLAAWLFIIYILPFIGFVIYWVAANEYRKRRRAGWHTRSSLPVRRRTSEPPLPDAEHDRYNRLLHLVRGLPVYPPSESARTTVYTDGRSFYSDLMHDLEGASRHIHMQFYIFRDDAIGRGITNLLEKKAAEGLEVKVIIDGIGSIGYPRSKIRELTKRGVQFHMFLPPLISVIDKRINYRNHRKIVVCDGKIGYFGGMNVGVEHLGHDKRIGRWRDTQLRVAGDAVHGLQHTFLKDWELVSGEKLADRIEYYPSSEAGLGGSRKEIMQIIPSGPDQADKAMFTLFYGMMAAAQRSIYITTPYFIPEESIKMALKAAALSGLDVRVLIPGNPDSRIAKFATLSHLEELMKAGVRVYEYLDGFIHAKSVIVDSVFATVGTANMDMRSFFSNFELNALVYTESLVRKLEGNFMNDLAHSREISYQAFRGRAAWQRMLEAGARMLSPLF